MKQSKIVLAVFLGLALATAGCLKKSSSEANMAATAGLESSTEELAQMPQTGTTAQQSSVEILPIETSPVTQGVPAPSAKAAAVESPAPADAGSLSRDKQIQTALKNAGFYNGNIDGKIGPASKRAIEAFQEKNGLKADGKVGPRTWAALQSYLSGQAPSTTETAASGN